MHIVTGKISHSSPALFPSAPSFKRLFIYIVILIFHMFEVQDGEAQYKNYL